MRPLINFVQYLSVILLFPAPWPEALNQLVNVLQGMNLDVVSFVSPECAGIPTNFYMKFLSMVGFVALVLASGHRPTFWLYATSRP